MVARPKFPLTPETEAVARRLVWSWDNGETQQVVELLAVPEIGAERFQFDWAFGAKDSFELPELGPLIELAECGLVKLTDISRNPTEIRFRVTLLQELRNAVEADFTLTDYALVNSPSQFADVLGQMLSAMTSTNSDLAAAIRNIATVDEATRVEKAGKVIEELGRGLGHIANTGTAIQAILLLAKFLGA